MCRSIVENLPLLGLKYVFRLGGVAIAKSAIFEINLSISLPALFAGLSPHRRQWALKSPHMIMFFCMLELVI